MTALVLVRHHSRGPRRWKPYPSAWLRNEYATHDGVGQLTRSFATHDGDDLQLRFDLSQVRRTVLDAMPVFVVDFHQEIGEHDLTTTGEFCRREAIGFVHGR